MNVTQSMLFGGEYTPKQAIDRNSLYPILFDLLQTMTLNDFVRTFTNEFRETIEYVNLRDGKNTCQNTSLLFNPHRLNTRSKNSAMSVFEAVKTESFVSGLARAILFDKQYDKNKDYLLNSFRLGINGVQYINEFQPYVARDLCKKYLLDKNSRVLDPCAGWGGRMIGVSAVCGDYTCFEPARETFKGLIKLYDFILRIDHDFIAVLNNLPFEDAKLKNDFFDFALTSPPYYDTELYTDEETNSLNRYKSFEGWCAGFYVPMIQKTMDALKPGCTFVLNIGSRNYPLSDVLKRNFQKYKIEKLEDYLSGAQGLGKTGEGETFYAITK